MLKILNIFININSSLIPLSARVHTHIYIYIRKNQTQYTGSVLREKYYQAIKSKNNDQTSVREKNKGRENSCTPIQQSKEEEGFNF